MSDALNLTGMLCPMPVLKTKKALAKVGAGDVVTVLTDDPHAVEDLRLFCEQSYVAACRLRDVPHLF